MHDAYEVRDAQYLMGRLADDGVIDPQRIGAAGGSYGGGMAIALGALRNRTMLPDGSLVPWTSPHGTPMQIAATTPEFTWSDLDYALMPNGATLDYVADAPYRGPLGDRRVGVQKQSLERQPLPGRPVPGLLRARGQRPGGRHHRLEGRHRTPAGRSTPTPPPRR